MEPAGSLPTDQVAVHTSEVAALDGNGRKSGEAETRQEGYQTIPPPQLIPAPTRLIPDDAPSSPPGVNVPEESVVKGPEESGWTEEPGKPDQPAPKKNEGNVERPAPRNCRRNSTATGDQKANVVDTPAPTVAPPTSRNADPQKRLKPRRKELHPLAC